jgi:hypothetical protein
MFIKFNTKLHILMDFILIYRENELYDLLLKFTMLKLHFRIILSSVGLN